VAGARALAEAIAGHPEIAWLRTGVDERQMQAVFELYFPRRHYFVASDPARIPELTTPAALRAQAERARRELALPTASAAKKLVASDPLGSFRATLTGLAGGRRWTWWTGSSSPATAATPCSSWDADAFDGNRQSGAARGPLRGVRRGEPAPGRDALPRVERRQRVRGGDRAQHPRRRQSGDGLLDRRRLRLPPGSSSAPGAIC
jgi:hypothetical protein